MLPREDALQAFDAGAKRYDAWFDTPEGRLIFGNEKQALRRLWREDQRPALEIGVGTGRFAEALHIEYGLDPAMGALRLATQRRVRVTQGRGEALPFADGSFGGVLIVATLCFAPDPTAVLREAARVLRPAGHLLVALIPADSPWGRHYLLKKSRGHPFYRFAQFLTVDRLETMLHAAGLKPLAASSTLVQSQPGILRREKVQTGFVAGAGFVTVLARRNGSDPERRPPHRIVPGSPQRRPHSVPPAPGTSGGAPQ